MIKKLTGNKVKEEHMAKFRGGKVPWPPLTWCDYYCDRFCGKKPGMDDIQQAGQFEYRT